jgi:enoyl-CoA hydratase
MPKSAVDIERRGPVGWILINDHQSTLEAGRGQAGFVGVHVALGMAVEELRWDPEVRAVVITGRNDGEFYRFSRRDHWDDPQHRGRLNPIAAAQAGTRRPPPGPSAHEALAKMPKPVVARVNGDAFGFGQAVLWGCDFILARDDARVAWGHTGMGELVDSDGEQRGFPWAITPSYGTAGILYMPPAKVKEFMMLSKVYTGRELADMNVFNAAVPADRLDGAVDELLDALLARPDAVLARTKALCNQHLQQQALLSERLADAYTTLDLWEHAARGEMD